MGEPKFSMNSTDNELANLFLLKMNGKPARMSESNTKKMVTVSKEVKIWVSGDTHCFDFKRVDYFLHFVRHYQK